jgi:iron(III) transport system substrate-binding protein
MVRVTPLSGLALVLMGLHLYAAPTALAQSSMTATPAEAIALYQGQDREQKLLEGARKEGGLSLYTSMIGPDQAALAEAFTKKYGIKLQSWRSSSEGLLQRVIAESRAGRFDADIVDNNVMQMEALRREYLLQKVESPHQAELIADAVPAHKEWIADSIDMIVQAYNTDKIKQADLPKTYRDLLDPKWKGQLGVESTDQHWFGTVLDQLGRDEGINLFKKIVDTNGISVRMGHLLLANMVTAGEVPLALTIYHYLPANIKKRGGPIEQFVIAPAIGTFRSVGLLKNARHPHAALLYYDLLLSRDGQQILLDRTRVPTSKDINSPWKNVSVKFIDPVRALDMNDQWARDFETAVTKRVRQ